LQALVDDDSEVALGEMLVGNLEEPDDAIERWAITDLVRHGLDELPQRTRRVLELRFGLVDGQPRTLIEVGQELGVSRERVRQLEVEGLRRLRRALRSLRPLLVER